MAVVDFVEVEEAVVETDFVAAVVVDFVEVDSVEKAVGNLVGNSVEVDDIDFDSAAENYSAGTDRKAVENFRESYCYRENYCCRDSRFAALCFVWEVAVNLPSYADS